MSEIQMLETIVIEPTQFNVLRRMVEMKPKGKFYQFDTFAGYVPAEPLCKLIVRVKREKGRYGSGNIAISRLDENSLQFVATANSGQGEDSMFTEVVDCNHDLLLHDSLIRGQKDFEREILRERGMLEEEDKPLEPTDVHLYYNISKNAGVVEVKKLLEATAPASSTDVILVDIDGLSFRIPARTLKDVLRLFVKSVPKGWWAVYVGSEVAQEKGKEVNRLTLGFLEFTSNHGLVGSIRHSCYINDVEFDGNWRVKQKVAPVHLNFILHGK